jgi:polyisoprenoid-binding protein YceI
MATTKWILDPTHSELGFKIKHLMISNVSGSFKNFDVVVETDEENDFSTAKVALKADMSSINTNNEQRDAHLKGSDFFSVDLHPEMEFSSKEVEMIDDENFKLHGDLTLRGITHPVTLNVEYSKVTRDPWGGERAGFIVTGKINRSQWGVNFNSIMDTGGLGLGEEVRISSELQLVKQPELIEA